MTTTISAHSVPLITNHGKVLAHLLDHPTDTAREIATAVGITERTALKIVGELEAGGYIKHTRAGRRNVYEIRTPKLAGVLRHAGAHQDLQSVIAKGGG